MICGGSEQETHQRGSISVHGKKAQEFMPLAEQPRIDPWQQL
jgi:hypothetical protein